MAAGFHAAGAAGFERTPWIVKPNIAATDHLAGNMDVVIFYEHEVVRQVAVPAQMDDLLDEPFAVIVAWMGLARKNKLNRAVPVFAKFHDVIELLENERSAFVGGKTPCKTNRQRVRIEQMVKANEIACRYACGHIERPAADKLNHLAPLAVTQRPQFLVRNKRGIGHLLPKVHRIDGHGPIMPKFLVRS